MRFPARASSVRRWGKPVRPAGTWEEAPRDKKGRKKRPGFAQLPRVKFSFVRHESSVENTPTSRRDSGRSSSGRKGLDSVRTYVVMRRILSVIFYTRPLRREKERSGRVRRRTNNAVA